MTLNNNIVMIADQMAALAAQRESVWGIRVDQDEDAVSYQQQRKRLIDLLNGDAELDRDTVYPVPKLKTFK